jgi:hypothetical protein
VSHDHRRMGRQQVYYHAFVGGLRCWTRIKGHAAIRWQCGQKFSECIEAACRGANPDDHEVNGMRRRAARERAAARSRWGRLWPDPVPSKGSLRVGFSEMRRMGCNIGGKSLRHRPNRGLNCYRRCAVLQDFLFVSVGDRAVENIYRQ